MNFRRMGKQRLKVSNPVPLAIEIDLNMLAQRFVRSLEKDRGYPLIMRMDNGPKMISPTLVH
ncbi:hypothetical protein ERHA54_08760 [Erwinia rhapontici]|uniref:Integrase-like protein n=1 Tax=Erwinia rhapontici TaxID=55212 RepID=A0ABN6DF86_ERWRD|nr:hypothetical protein ERHA53_08310 [Erwinia rhapontici]BCQ38273.1 hypothetical protein ERHA54_08760 [Erwinia rhapontici]BCQ43405.1 hypothetical protein ERHA55_09320 [Erwinia rhapontici]